MSGYVYAVKAEGQDLFKIGQSTDPIQRLQQLKTGCPYSLVLYRTDSTFFPREMERVFHALLAGYRTQGEWYAIDARTVDAIFDGTPTPGLLTVTFNELGRVFIRPNFSGNTEGDVSLSSTCTTPAELEYECLQLINDLLAILARARHDIQSGVRVYWNPTAWKPQQQ